MIPTDIVDKTRQYLALTHDSQRQLELRSSSLDLSTTSIKRIGCDNTPQSSDRQSHSSSSVIGSFVAN